MLRTVLAVPAGLIVGGIVITIVQIVAMNLLPPLEGVPTDRELIRPGDIPAVNMASVLVAWAAGAFLGGGTAARISRHAKRRLALIVGAFFLIAGIYNMATIPSPLWFHVAGVLLFLPSAHLGAHMLGGSEEQ